MWWSREADGERCAGLSRAVPAPSPLQLPVGLSVSPGSTQGPPLCLFPPLWLDARAPPSSTSSVKGPEMITMSTAVGPTTLRNGFVSYLLLSKHVKNKLKKKPKV